MEFEIQEVIVTAAGADYPLILSVGLTVKELSFLIYYAYRKGKWETYGVTGDTYELQRKKGKKIKQWIYSAQGRNEMLGHNKVRLHTLMV